MLSRSMTPTTLPDHAAAVAGNGNRASAKSDKNFLIWFPSLLFFDRLGSYPCPGHPSVPLREVRPPSGTSS